MSEQWRLITDLPTEAGMVEYYHGNWPDEVYKIKEHPYRDERHQLGFFDGRSFRESGTGHEVFESWKEPWMTPTHWRRVGSPPVPTR